MKTLLAIEMQDISSQKYGVIHRDGCRDLRDGLTIGEASSPEEVDELADEATGWDYVYTEDHYHLAGCAKSALAKEKE